jgi:hypothetical protein
LFYTPTACTKIIDQNLDWDDFKKNYALIISSPKLKACVVETYTNLSDFYCFLGQIQEIYISYGGKGHTSNLLETKAMKS